MADLTLAEFLRVTRDYFEHNPCSYIVATRWAFDETNVARHLLPARNLIRQVRRERKAYSRRTTLADFDAAIARAEQGEKCDG